jgi:acetyl-CoA acetyltransferase
VSAGKGWQKGANLAARRAYEQSSLGPEDVDLAELHDAAASAELQLYEQVQFAAPCEGPRLIRDGSVVLGGPIPVNTSGGLLARGHPVGATGLAQVYEAVTQLRGRAGGRQVEGAKVVLTQNGGGWLDGDNVAHAVHVFVR